MCWAWTQSPQKILRIYIRAKNLNTEISVCVSYLPDCIFIHDFILPFCIQDEHETTGAVILNVDLGLSSPCWDYICTLNKGISRVEPVHSDKRLGPVLNWQGQQFLSERNLSILSPRWNNISASNEWIHGLNFADEVWFQMRSPFMSDARECKNLPLWKLRTGNQFIVVSRTTQRLRPLRISRRRCCASSKLSKQGDSAHHQSWRIFVRILEKKKYYDLQWGLGLLSVC